jgi:hypothetical protein
MKTCALAHQSLVIETLPRLESFATFFKRMIHKVLTRMR